MVKKSNQDNLSRITLLLNKKKEELSEMKKLFLGEVNKDFIPNLNDESEKRNSLPDFFKIGILIGHEFAVSGLYSSADKGILFELNRSNREEVNLTMENIALQVLQNTDNDYLNFTIIDPKKLGSNFRFLRRFKSHMNMELVFQRDHVIKSIDQHLNNSIRVINECLTHHKDIADYNLKTGEKEPYRMIFIADFPYGFEDVLSQFNTILTNSKEAGVFVCMTVDRSLINDSNKKEIGVILSQLTLFQEFGNPEDDHYRVRNNDSLRVFNDLYTLKLDRREINPDNMEKICMKLLSDEKKEMVFNASRGLRIPIGKSSGVTHYLTIGHETQNYHGIIGGQPGKGKTVLLNNIIAKGIECYNQEEIRFFLMDCAGVGFMEFENSKHIMSICSSSEIKQCISKLALIDEELAKRERLFKKAKVVDLVDYVESTGEKMPRLLCLIDEFHMLFTDGYESDEYVENLLVERVIRIGRKFGVHLFVSTQSLGGGVRRSFLDNIPLRIALGMTEDQSSEFLGLRNTKAANLEQGVAIYNDENGSLGANSLVRVNYIDDNSIQKIIQLAQK